MSKPHRSSRNAKIEKGSYPFMWLRVILPKELVQIKSTPIGGGKVFDHMIYYHANEN